MEKISKTSGRLFAFGSILFSTVAVVGTMIFYPLLFHYMQTLDSNIEMDLDFCKSRSRDMWNAMLDMHMTKGQSVPSVNEESAGRLVRAAMDRSNAAAIKFWAAHVARDEPHDKARDQPPGAPAGNSNGAGCCTCHRGVSGAPGSPGRDGYDGANGGNGQPGDRGDPAPADPRFAANQPRACPCEPGLVGDAGAPGNRGPDGPQGDVGMVGDAAKPGAQGGRGPQGEKGRDGLSGAKGNAGDAGKVIVKQAAAGAPGNPGRNGNVGPQGAGGKPGLDGAPGGSGAPGDKGVPGVNGRPGNQGPEGKAGPQGDNGACNQCPPPRLSPGY